MAEISDKLKTLADTIVALTLKEAVDLAAHLKEAHGIEPAAGGGGGGGGGGAPAAAAAPVEAKTTFDVVLTAAGDKKIQVIKVVRAATNLGLTEAKALVEGAPKTIKESVTKDEAEKLKKEIEEQGGKVELK